jgi:signal transduction histidine kinase
VTTEQGLAMIDLPHLPRRAEGPTVYIRDIVVGRKSQHPGERLVLPPGTSHVEMYFDPVELSAPHRIRLQYKLDGVDDGWLDAPATHVAIYSGMSPGSHTFHVRATNRDGVWDLAGMTFPVIQEPFFYQTAWFQALGAASFLGVLYGLYRYRVRQLAHEFNIRLEGRVMERTRIARELHDTLLQSFQGLMLRLQLVDDWLPEGRAKSKLEESLQLADQAIAEGRTALYDLRSPAATADDLATALGAVGEELVTANGPAFRLETDGATRDLHPVIRDEIYRIAREALRNAFGHAEARQIEVELTYGERAFQMRIRDDGKGIPPEVLQEGRSGHYGLCGMRERARQIGGKLEIWSRAGAGTEIELSIARSIAYPTPPARTFWERFRRKQAQA